MNKIIIALSIAVFGCYSAEAQVAKMACEAPKGKVCKKYGGAVSCYKTPYAHDFKICKDEYGYHVCCEEPNMTNSTHPKLNMAAVRNYPPNPMEMRDEQSADDQQNMNNDARLSMVAPQSQSYPNYEMNSATSYEGYYSTKKRNIRVCYGGDNIAELNRAPYNGCPTPAYDGPEANRARNVNVSNPNSNFPVPDVTGQSR